MVDCDIAVSSERQDFSITDPVMEGVPEDRMKKRLKVS